MWVAELRRVLFLVLEYLNVGRRPRICVFLFNLGSVDVSIAFYPTVRCFLSLQSPTKYDMVVPLCPQEYKCSGTVLLTGVPNQGFVGCLRELLCCVTYQCSFRWDSIFFVCINPAVVLMPENETSSATYRVARKL